MQNPLELIAVAAQRLATNTRRLGPGFLAGRTEVASPVSPTQRGVAIPRTRSSSAGGAAGGKEYATVVVAAGDSTAHGRAAADYVCDGTGDDVEINAALVALGATGGRVLLLEGTYTVGDSITLAGTFAMLEGQGPGTVIDASGVGNLIVMAGAYQEVSRLYAYGGTVRGIDMSGAGFNPVVRDCIVAGGKSDAGIYGGGLLPQIIGNRVPAVATAAAGIRPVGGLCAGNTVRSGFGATGILLSNTSDALVHDNSLYLCRTGITITNDANYNSVQGNVIRSGVATGGYGIDIDDATCDGNLVTNNDLHLSGSLGSLRDLGTGTVTTAGNRL